ncbi:hypothetical protein CFI10_11640 [Marinobacterium iners]|uniref:hypothetical protein n=1 Tax=Marinobacterium iners TaxID=48076 RepID=UPI001A8F5DDB|nr:hypothetical protein [Marinobacterium iners]QSR35642.1 hypothetical protein CFI10_11640 [Marinobacterium iners]
MFKRFKGVVYLIAIFFSFTASSEDIAYPDCGLKDGKIDPFNSEICPSDTILQSFAAVYPEQVEKMGVSNAIGYPTSKISESEHYNPSYATEAILARLTWLFISIIAAVGIFNLSRTSIPLIGSALDKGEWNKQYTKLSIATMVLLLLFYAPYGNFTLIQHFFLICAFYSLKLATALYAYFLADLESKNIDSITSTDKFNKSQEVETDSFKHNKAYAYQYVSSLTHSMLCKQSTTNYTNLTDATSSSWFSKNQVIDNLYIENEGRLIKSSFGDETFLNYTDKLIGTDKRHINGIIFGKPTEDKKTSNTFDFECGSIKATLPVIKDTKLEKIAKNVRLYDFIQETVGQIKHYEASAIQDTIASGAMTLRMAVADDLGLKSPSVANKEEKEILKKMSLVYHQNVLAALLVGYGENDKGSLIKENTYMLRKSLSQAETIARGIREQACFDNRENVQGSVRTYNHLVNGTDINGVATTACLDTNEKGVVGVLASKDNKSMYYEREELVAARESSFTALEKARDGFISDIYELRTAVERSYVLDIFEIDNARAYFIQLRQEGVATIATNFTTLLSSFKNTNLNQAILRNTVTTDTGALSDTYIPLNDDADVSGLFPILDNYVADAFTGYNFNSEDIVNINFEDYTDYYLKESTERNYSGVDFTSNITSFLTSPLTKFKEVYEWQNSECEGKFLCYISSAHPIQRQAEFGNTLLNVSATIIITREIMSVASAMKTDKSKGKLKKNKYGVAGVGTLASLAGGAFAIINSVLDPIMPLIYMIGAAGIALIILKMALVFILKLTFITFILNVIILFMSIPFFMLRFFRFQTHEEFNKAVMEFVKLILFVIAYLPLFLIGILISTILLSVFSSIISYMTFEMFGEAIQDPTFVMGIVVMCIVFVITAFVNYKITMHLFRKMNDLPLDSMKKFFDSEEAEEKMVRDLNTIAAGSILSSLKSVEQGKQEKLKKQIQEERRRREKQKEEQKNEGMK